MTHYYGGRSGDSFVEASIHNSEDCPELAAPIRPIADSTVESLSDANRCSECHDLEPSEPHDGDIEQLIVAGVCPWCDRDGFEAVGRHAAAAHPDEWDAYQD